MEVRAEQQEQCWVRSKKHFLANLPNLHENGRVAKTKGKREKKLTRDKRSISILNSIEFFSLGGICNIRPAACLVCHVSACLLISSADLSSENTLLPHPGQ